MNGPEHYREAERLLEQAAGQDQPAGGRVYLATAAETHAILALTAVTISQRDHAIHGDEAAWTGALGDK